MFHLLVAVFSTCAVMKHKIQRLGGQEKQCYLPTGCKSRTLQRGSEVWW